MSAGIQKLSEFHTVLGLLGARTGLLTDYSGIAKDSGVSSVTVKEWIGFLERANLIYLLKPYFNNLISILLAKLNPHNSGSGLFCIVNKDS